MRQDMMARIANAVNDKLVATKKPHDQNVERKAHPQHFGGSSKPGSYSVHVVPASAIVAMYIVIEFLYFLSLDD
jgi:hypothetical protein